ncbi:MAG: hypothetical protein KGK11_14925 [Sphingomonadales bacterium]|nr:hypothetical protein [Sphingomonadales bacterium]
MSGRALGGLLYPVMPVKVRGRFAALVARFVDLWPRSARCVDQSSVAECFAVLVLPEGNATRAAQALRLCLRQAGADCRIYIGCRAGDATHLAAMIGAIGADPRVRIVLGRAGRGGWMRRLRRAVRTDERRHGCRFAAVLTLGAWAGAGSVRRVTAVSPTLTLRA